MKDEKKMSPAHRRAPRKTSKSATPPAMAQATNSATSTRKTASPAKLVIAVVLALALGVWYNFRDPYLFPRSFVLSRLESLSSSLLSTFLLYPTTVVESDSDTPASSPGFLNLPHTYALCTHPGDEKRIYTVDVNNSVVECVGISGERVIGAGDLDAVRTSLLANTCLDGDGDCRMPYVRHIPPGAAVLPGLSDSHCHILEYGASQQIPMSEAKSVKETIKIIRSYIESDQVLLQNKDKIIEGWGWDHASWEIPEMPSWNDLESDPITADRHFILQSRDGHAIWVSKRTLEDNAASIPEGQVEGGVVFRDAEGKPTGIFMDSAQDLIARPKPTTADLQRRFKTTVKHALKSGLTSLHDAGFKPESYAFFERMATEGVLPLRVYDMTYFDENEKYWGDSDVPYTADLARDGDRERLSRRSIKIFADGGSKLCDSYNNSYNLICIEDGSAIYLWTA